MFVENNTGRQNNIILLNTLFVRTEKLEQFPGTHSHWFFSLNARGSRQRDENGGRGEKRERERNIRNGIFLLCVQRERKCPVSPIRPTSQTVGGCFTAGGAGYRYCRQSRKEQSVRFVGGFPVRERRSFITCTMLPLQYEARWCETFLSKPGRVERPCSSKWN